MTKETNILNSSIYDTKNYGLPITIDTGRAILNNISTIGNYDPIKRKGATYTVFEFRNIKMSVCSYLTIMCQEFER